MAIIRVDLAAASNGDGSFATPRNVPPTSVAYGDFVLFKGGTSAVIGASGWTVPAPSGTGSATNRLVIGSYDPLTGNRTMDASKRATVSITGNSDVFLLQNDYITVENLEIVGARTFPSAGVRATDASYITVNQCRISKGPGTAAGGYGIRLDNTSTSAAARSNWVVTNNVIESTGGNAAIHCVWGDAAGTANRFVTGITVTDNVVYGNRFKVTSTTNDGIRLLPRATGAINADRPGIMSKDVVVERNKVFGTHSYAYSIMGVGISALARNSFRFNSAINIGDGGTDMHCMWLACCDDWIVEGNYVNGSNAWIGQNVGTGVGIFIDKPFNDADGCNRILVRGNVVRNVGRGGTLNSEVGGAGIMVLLSSNITVEANVADSCTNGIVVIGWYGSGNKSQNILVRNNIAANSLEANYYTVKGADLVTLSNNISYGGKFGYGLQTSGVLPVTNYAETNNLQFGATVLASMTSNEPESGSFVQSSRAVAASTVTADPLLFDDALPWAGLKAGSPCWGSGQYIQGARDRYGRRYSNPPHIGPWAVATR